MIKVNRSDLVTELKAISGSVDRGKTNPALACVLCECKSGTMSLSTTNAVTAMTTSIQDKAYEQARFLVGHGDFLALIDCLEDESIKIDVRDREIQIDCGQHTSTMTTIDPDEYVSLPDCGDAPKINVQFDRVKAMCSSVGFCMGRDSSYNFSAMLLRINGSVEIAASDGLRLAVARSQIDCSSDEIQELLRPEVVAQLDKLNDTCEISRSDQHIFFNDGQRSLSSITINNRYPDYRKLIDNLTVNLAVDVSRDTLLRMLRRVSLLATVASRPVMLGFSPEGITAQSVASEKGHGTESLQRSIGGSAEIKINAGSAIDGLGSCPAERARIEVCRDSREIDILRFSVPPNEDGEINPFEWTYILPQMTG